MRSTDLTERVRNRRRRVIGEPMIGPIVKSQSHPGICLSSSARWRSRTVTNRIGSVYITRRYFWFLNPWCWSRSESRNRGNVERAVVLFRHESIARRWQNEANFSSYVEKNEPCKVSSVTWSYSRRREWKGETSFSNICDATFLQRDVSFFDMRENKSKDRKWWWI